MECSQINDLLSEYIDDILDNEKKTLVEEHLSVCEECARELDAVRSSIIALGTLERIKAPVDFLERVRERIEKPSLTKRLMDWLFHPWQIKIPLEVTATLVIVFLAVLGYQGMKSTEEFQYARSRVEAPSPQAPPGRVNSLMLEEESVKPSIISKQSASKKAVEKPKPIQLVLLIKSETDLDAQRSKGFEAVSGRSEISSETGLTPKSEPPSPLLAGEETQPSAPRKMTGDEVRTFRGSREIPSEKKLKEDYRSSLKDTITRQGKQLENNHSIDDKTAWKMDKPSSIESVPVLSKLQEIIESEKGTVLAIESEKKTPSVRLISVQIPPRNYASLLEKLRSIGRFKEPPKEKISTEGQEAIPVQIELILTEDN